MKNKIIRIDSLSEINTTKISVYDMNNRYLDPGGNLYGLKYDRLNKKIEIIKLLRIHSDDASSIHQKMIKNKMIEREAANFNDEYDNEGGLKDFGIQDEVENIDDIIDIETFFNNSIALMGTHRNRLKGIINNINHSNVYPKEDKSTNIELEEIFRNIEIDSIQKFDKIENYQRELTNYPRSITYYESKLDKKGRESIEKIADNSDKVQKFIYYYEMITEIKNIYTILNKFITNLSRFIENTDREKITERPSNEKQYFKDAETSINNTVEEIKNLLEEIDPVEEYICSLDYFN